MRGISLIKAMDLRPQMSNTLATVNIVSGLPRSGTSMMMKILSQGGLEAYTDNVRQADSRNPNGYFEFEKTKNRLSYIDWINDTDSKLVKVVAPMLTHLPANKLYNVVFLHRDIDSVITSQTDMADHFSHSVWDDNDSSKLHNVYESIIEKTKDWLSKRPNIRTLHLKYEDVLSNPQHNIQRLKEFFSSYELDSQKMLESIEPLLNHNKSSHKKSEIIDSSTQVRDIEGVIFDFDGVLIDSERIMYLSYINSFKQFLPNETPPPFSEYCKYLGQRLSDIIAKLGLPPGMEEAFIAETYNNMGEIQIFDGVKEMLKSLKVKGVPMAIATGKDSIRTHAILKDLKIDEYFDVVMCSDIVENPKPAPDMANIILEKFNLQADKVVFVGDAIADIKCGTSAGTKTAIAAWGDPHESVYSVEYDFKLETPSDLFSLLK